MPDGDEKPRMLGRKSERRHGVAHQNEEGNGSMTSDIVGMCGVLEDEREGQEERSRAETKVEGRGDERRGEGYRTVTARAGYALSCAVASLPPRRQNPAVRGRGGEGVRNQIGQRRAVLEQQAGKDNKQRAIQVV